MQDQNKYFLVQGNNREANRSVDFVGEKKLQLSPSNKNNSDKLLTEGLTRNATLPINTQQSQDADMTPAAAITQPAENFKTLVSESCKSKNHSKVIHITLEGTVK